jgi:hypothetical protein
MSQQRQDSHGTSSSVDITPSVAAAKPPLRPRLDRPNSSPSTTAAARPKYSNSLINSNNNNNNSNNTHAHTSSLSSQPLLSSASSVTSSTATSTSGRTARPANAVLPGVSRPKTVYQAVTWKENLDAFNRRLRRGSLSLDAAAQEEELASQALAQARAQQLQQQRLQADQDTQGKQTTDTLKRKEPSKCVHTSRLNGYRLSFSFSFHAEKYHLRSCFFRISM